MTFNGLERRREKKKSAIEIRVREKGCGGRRQRDAVFI